MHPSIKSAITADINWNTTLTMIYASSASLIGGLIGAMVGLGIQGEMSTANESLANGVLNIVGGGIIGSAVGAITTYLTSTRLYAEHLNTKYSKFSAEHGQAAKKAMWNCAIIIPTTLTAASLTQYIASKEIQKFGIAILTLTALPFIHQWLHKPLDSVIDAQILSATQLSTLSEIQSGQVARLTEERTNDINSQIARITY